MHKIIEPFYKKTKELYLYGFGQIHIIIILLPCIFSSHFKKMQSGMFEIIVVDGGLFDAYSIAVL